ncbi:MAG TPA: alpha/beta hydrolase [Nannocystaceae bacterium]|nr:alpha/beta hydrolase [Nannocystaceae bacterium]
MTSPLGAEPGSELAIERPDGATIWARTTGDPQSPALLVLDGIGCSGWAFRRIVPQLAERLYVVQADYPGHGRSPTPPRPWALSMPDLADHANAVLEALAIERATVVGFSMGFQVALELYRRHRARVAALVSLAGPSGKALATFQGTDVFAHALPLVRAASRYASVTTMKLWRTVLPSKWLPWLGLHGQLNPMRIELSDLEFYLRQMSEIHPELFLDMLGEAARHTADDLLPGIRVPTLVIAGAQDRFVPAETQRRIAFAIPTAQWMVIEDGSHALPAEFGMEIAERLLAFVDEA